MNISYSSAVSSILNNFQYKNTIFSGAVHRNVVNFNIYCIAFNALSNGISFQTGLNLESIHVNFKRECVMSRATYTIMYVESVYI